MIAALSLALLMTDSRASIGPINLTGKSPKVGHQRVEAAEGTNVRPVLPTWKREGKWIWRDDQGNPPQVTRFRRKFDLTTVPAHVTLAASADVRYRLWINGVLVARGPADTGRDYDSGAPGPWFDDLRDVTRFLHAGQNVVAAEVFPDSLVSSEGSSGHPGLKVDLHFPEQQSVHSDETWRSSLAPDLAHHQGPNGFQIDATLEPVGWQKVDFDDSNWSASVLAEGERKPTLVSELAPPLEAVIPAIGTDRVSANVKVKTKTGRATFTSDGSYAVRFPHILSAYLALTVKGHRGARLLVMPNEPNAPGANRRAEILLREGVQTVELPYFDSFSTVNLEAKGVTSPIEVQEVRAIFTSYPVRYRGSFECDQPELNRKWEICRWLTQICMQTHHLDSPHHQEPICDPGDYLIEALNSYYAFGESGLARQDLRKLARVMEDRHYQSFHTSYSLLWLQMLIQYLDYTGDEALVTELAPYAHHLLDRFETYIGKNGLISEAPNYMFMDWVEIAGFNAHHPPAVIGQGYMTALYYRALADDARIAKLQNDGARVEKDEALRTNIHAAFERELWSETEGLYRDGKPHQTTVAPNQWLPADTDVETFSTQVNALAVCAGLTGPDRSRQVMEKVLNRSDMNCQPYFMHFVFEALAKSSRFETYALPQMARWKVLPDTESFFEMWNQGDRSHAWNATLLYQMSGRILGVRPLSPGFDTFAIDPHPSGLNWAKGTVPTPHGSIRVEWHRAEKGLSADFTVPQGTTARFGSETFGPGRHTGRL